MYTIWFTVTYYYKLTNLKWTKKLNTSKNNISSD